MEEKRDKDGVFLAPVTPAKLGCRVLRRAGVVARESLNSGDNAKLGSTNSDGNLLREGDFCRMLGTKAGFADTDSEKSSRIDGSNRTVGELGEISCMQLLLSQIGRPNHEVVGPPQTSANRSAEEAGSTHTNPPGVPVKEVVSSPTNSGVAETKASDAVGTGSLDSIPDSEEQSGRKRKKSSIDLNERPRQRMKVKKHRPKIFDASKPKKIPNVKIERKHTSKLRKTQKTPDLSPQAPKPPTPEPLAPRLVMCEGGISCEWKTVDENSQQARISCRKILDFDLADKVEEEGNDKNFDLLGNGDADVDNINDIALADVMFRVKSMRQTVHTYEHHRWQKSENKSIFSCLLRNLESESEIQDFGFSRGIREIIDEYHQWDVKALQFLHFPTAFKGRRTKRQRRTVYSKFRMCSKFEGNINVHGATTKTRLPARSHTMKNMVFRSKVPLSFNSVPKRKRSKPRRSNDMSVISSPNVESCCTPGKDSLPITRGVETCLLHVENKSSIVNETNEKTEVKFSMEAEMLYQIQENNLQHGNDLFQLESQNSVTTEAELFPVPTKAVTTEAKLFPVPTKVVTTEAELFPVPTKVTSYNQIQENKLKCDNGLFESRLGLPQHENKVECGNNLFELASSLPQYENRVEIDNGFLELELGLPQYEDITYNTMEELLGRQEYFPKENIPDIEDLGSYDAAVMERVNFMPKLEYSHMRDESMQLVVQESNANGALVSHTHENWQLVVREENMNGAIVPYKGRKGNKPKKITPKVDLDPETRRVWKMLMENGDRYIAQNNDEKEEWWANERERFHKRVNFFISCMRTIQGNRRFSQWKGSVVDSVVGVFLTQNVSDHLSSSAYMSLASRFSHDKDKKTPSGEELVGRDSAADSVTNDIHSKKPYSSQIKLQKNQVLVGQGEENVVCVTDNLALDSAEVKDGRQNFDGIQVFLSCQMDSIKADPSSQRSGGEKDATKVHENITCDGCTLLSKCQESQEKREVEDIVGSNNKHSGSRREKKTKNNDSTSIKKKGRVAKKKENPIDWDELRRTYSSDRNNLGSTMDSVDWGKVRCATVDEIAHTIAKRGMHNQIADRIKKFLDRMVKDHEYIDLEWLRNVPPDKAKEYLLSFNGLGLKSTECVRLLTLHHRAFPVDTNVGRIAVRLGWVPLQPLPGNLEIDLLNNYPNVDSVQKYLWPRLCKLPQHQLYELHYQMITFGKVFCTKRQPNCKACPLKAECRHYASASARARLCLPGPQEKNIVRTNALDVIDADAIRPVPKPALHFLEDRRYSESIHGTWNCNPIVEMPASPEPQNKETVEMDIEDLCDGFESLDGDSDGEMPTIKLNTEEFRKSSLNSIKGTDCLFLSKELVPLASGATSIPAPKLRSVAQFRTRHHVYELPDGHPILSQFEKREPDDPCPYLFLIRLSDGANQEQDDGRVNGTILIPCRTANRGNFPLNGTYYQVNEVFADDKSSNYPISVPRDWLWHLAKRFVYCGNSTRSIFKEMQQGEIKACFLKGFVCVRAFDRETREPKPLAEWLHPHGGKGDAKDDEEDEEEDANDDEEDANDDEEERQTS